MTVVLPTGHGRCGNGACRCPGPRGGLGRSAGMSWRPLARGCAIAPLSAVALHVRLGQAAWRVVPVRAGPAPSLRAVFKRAASRGWGRAGQQSRTARRCEQSHGAEAKSGPGHRRREDEVLNRSSSVHGKGAATVTEAPRGPCRTATHRPGGAPPRRPVSRPAPQRFEAALPARAEPPQSTARPGRLPQQVRRVSR